MLISFSVENFFSIKNETMISLVASNGKEMRDTHVFTPELKNKVKPFDLLRSAVIYGPNAGGKSSFFRAIFTMSWIVSDSSKGFQFLPVIPFMLSNKTETAPTTFEIIIVVDGIRYQYGFSATREKIHAEWLFAFPKGRTQTLFERDYDKKTKKYKYTLGDALKGQKEVWCDATNPKALFLSTAVQLNSKQLQPIYDWFAADTKLMFISASGISPDLSLLRCKEFGGTEIINFLKVADFAIEDIRVDNINPSSETISKDTSTYIHVDNVASKTQFHAKTLHKTEEGGYIAMDLGVESDGTQCMLALAGPFLHVLEEGTVLVVDELNQKLHPHLVRYLVDIFNNPKTNPNNAQLIFTTHAVSLLKQDIFRRDQIWFCEREENQATTLFPLTDFRPRKGHEDFETYYMSGRYGALPVIGNFSDFTPKKVKK